MFAQPNEGVEKLLLMVTMIASIYVTAVICAVFPKRWLFFQYNDATSYPTLGYIISGLIAIIASFGISLLFKILIFAGNPEVNGLTASFIKAWEDFSTNSYPWLIMSFVTAVLTAFLIDWKYTHRLKANWQQHIINIGIMVALLVTSAILVYWWLCDLNVNENYRERVPIVRIVCITSIVGVVLGYFVLEWRQIAKKKEENFSGMQIREPAATVAIE